MFIWKALVWEGKAAVFSLKISQEDIKTLDKASHELDSQRKNCPQFPVVSLFLQV